ncbi:hypothetical protein PanWU01x14_032870 [Parasponia andersonii]|uniref:Uncharacterized protein n=1 Tax=Parasponia andersonii TaxID=3476 RepID=A0A2P5DTI1_PARAD|nr:hypothetical protein PanWU01x14_032870 [Parasponia andersonii]
MQDNPETDKSCNLTCWVHWRTLNLEINLKSLSKMDKMLLEPNKTCLCIAPLLQLFSEDDHHQKRLSHTPVETICSTKWTPLIKGFIAVTTIFVTYQKLRN